MRFQARGVGVILAVLASSCGARTELNFGRDLDDGGPGGPDPIPDASVQDDVSQPDTSGGDERGARPLMQRRARIALRQAKRAADKGAETGIEQAAPVDLEISRHRDC